MSSIWRILLPGLAFLAVLIGGGYATGRELISFYISSGPFGGLLAMMITTAIWSLTMMIVLELSRRLHAFDYKTFFERLIGPGWIAFELAYFALLIVVMSIIGAAAGEIVTNILGIPRLVGTSILVILSTVVLMLGSTAVTAVLSYWSVVLYVCYIVFFWFFMRDFGSQSLSIIANEPIGEAVFLNGLKYAGVNINCFVSILYLAALLKSKREAYIAGFLVGPIAIVPGMLFYFAMMAFYPEISDETIPLTFMLAKLNQPAFELVFQVAILGTLLQTGVGMIHAVNERIDAVYKIRDNEMSHWVRGMFAFLLMVFSITIAESVGLVSLIDNGYGTLSWVFIVVIFIPVFTVGIRLLRTVPGHMRSTPDAGA